MRKVFIFGGVLYFVVLQVVAVLAFFAPHRVPYQGWRLKLPPQEPTAYVAERHLYIQWLDKFAEPGAVALVGASHLEGMDPALLERPVLKYAAGGDTLRNTGQRVLSYPNLANSSAIILWLGFNDIAHRGPDEIGADLPMVLDNLPEDVPVITLALAPTSVARKKADIAAINALYRPICEQDARCQFLDVIPLLQGPDGGLSPEYDRGDGIHLNRDGYRKLAAAIKPLLPPIQTLPTSSESAAP